MSCALLESRYFDLDFKEKAYNVAPAISVDGRTAAFVTITVGYWPLAWGSKVNSKLFWTIDVRVTRDPLLPTPTPTKAVAAVFTASSSYQTMPATSATMTQPPQTWLADEIAPSPSTGASND